jgi:uncharacterized protein YjbI with pentapeptide repeats
MMSDEQQSQPTKTAVQDRLSPEGHKSWPDYWNAHGMSWRTEPEIDAERQQYLAERRAIQPDFVKGVYPFKDVKLDRADVEWLLATHESRGTVGPVWWAEEKGKPADERRVGLDLRGADLQQTALGALPLACVRGGPVLSELNLDFSALPDVELPPIYIWTAGTLGAAAHLEQADLHEAHLEHAELNWAHLAGARLRLAHLEGAQLMHADLKSTNLSFAHFEGAFMYGATLRGLPFTAAIEAHFEHADLHIADLGNVWLIGAHFEDADLRGVRFDDDTLLNGAWFGSKTDGVARLADIKWRGTNLAQVHWVTPERWTHGRAANAGDLGTPLVQVQRRLRASHQLALLLRSQGLSSDADSFAYNAQVLQRRVHRLQRRPLRYFGSWLLDLISGYGYRPIRSLFTYLCVVGGFAAVYYLISALILAPTPGPVLSPLDAAVFSMTSFHGRGFVPNENIGLSNPLTILAAIEAFVGLFIEITFIATFTQRFFSR